MTSRVRAAFDVEKVTKRFYDRFKKEHSAFLDFIEGIENLTDREWYASLMLNRMMFIYFIQKRGFLRQQPKLSARPFEERVRQQQGEGNFLGFYRLFLLRLFHEGLGDSPNPTAPRLGRPDRQSPLSPMAACSRCMTWSGTTRKFTFPTKNSL